MNIRTNTILSDFLTLELFDLDSKLSNTNIIHEYDRSSVVATTAKRIWVEEEA
ncbi:hypothetical protein TrispH2_011125 [Trichoplax sp. H2]|nr:hypothetical protein TrispH2_011125 [Trichoplax sp. H2]|eukprot:RDD36559.1 hypothetical protein TrispH2_011125 [Trichoplax sp. H2]